MARPAQTPSNRAAAVTAATKELGPLVTAAVYALNNYGASDPRTIAAWEAVEKHGATVHRQARLLAGKSKGG